MAKIVDVPKLLDILILGLSPDEILYLDKLLTERDEPTAQKIRRALKQQIDKLKLGKK